MFGNNIASTFNLLEAAIAGGAARFVNFSSETVPVHLRAAAVLPEYLLIDEEHPVRPQDARVTAKWFGGAPSRARRRAVGDPPHLDPPVLVQDEPTSATSGPIVRDPSVQIGNYCSYIDVHDLCDSVVLAIETDLPAHEVFSSPRRTRSAGIRWPRPCGHTTG